MGWSIAKIGDVEAQPVSVTMNSQFAGCGRVRMERQMIRVLVIALIGIALVTAGCGGGGIGAQFGVITGNVTDIEGRPIVDALVTLDDGVASTRTTQQGIFRIDGAREGYRTVVATIDIDGVRYRGQNVANLVVDSIGDQVKNVNITAAPENSLGSFDGYVRDGNGLPIQGARVFAVVDVELSAATTVTNSSGYYRLNGLIRSQTGTPYYYTVTASASGFENSIATNKVVTAGGVSLISFTLNGSDNPGLNPPVISSAVAWTVPDIPAVSAGGQNTARAIDAIKNVVDPWRKTAKRAAVTRDTPFGSLIEIDLQWGFIDDPALLGYGIFRGTGTQSMSAIDFLRDPTANFFADQDRALTPDVRTFYYIKALNTDYPDLPGSASAPSNTVSANPMQPFGAMFFNLNTRRFSWDSVSGASDYRIIVYNIFPDYDVIPVADVTVSGDTFWTGSNLQRNRSYYWVVIALGDHDGSRYTARSMSRIGFVTVP